MKFNKVTRGSKNVRNTLEDVYSILDSHFVCNIAYTYEGRPMITPISYGRIGSVLYIHGSKKNFMVSMAVNAPEIAISVFHVDGLVLAKSLFHTSVNYRSLVAYGKAELVEPNTAEWMEGIKAYTEHVIPGRGEEVILAEPNELKATNLVKITIESASVKVREGEPRGDDGYDNEESWSGVIPLNLIAGTPIHDSKYQKPNSLSNSVLNFLKKWNYKTINT